MLRLTVPQITILNNVEIDSQFNLLLTHKD